MKRLGLTLGGSFCVVLGLVLLAMAGPSNTPGIFGVGGAIVSQGTTRAPIGGPGWVLVTKSGNTAITNSTVAVPDPDLCIVLATDSSYEIRARINYGGTAVGTSPGFRFMGTAAPAGHAGYLLIDAITFPAAGDSISAVYSPCLLPCTTGVIMETYGDVNTTTTAMSRVVLGQLRGPRNPTSGGTWCMAWANQTAAGTTTVIAGSTMAYRQITP
jgi:hypothetical protein